MQEDSAQIITNITTADGPSRNGSSKVAKQQLNSTLAHPLQDFSSPHLATQQPCATPSENATRQRLHAAVRSALSYSAAAPRQEDAESAACSRSFQHSLFACTLVCTQLQHQVLPTDQRAVATSGAAQAELEQLLMHVVQYACTPCGDANTDSMQINVRTAISIIPHNANVSSSQHVMCNAWYTMHALVKQQHAAKFVAAALSSLTQPPRNTCSHSVSTGDIASAHSACDGEATIGERNMPWRAAPPHVSPSMHGANVCDRWVRAAVAAMVSVGAGKQQAHAWWCALCCAQHSTSDGSTAQGVSDCNRLPCTIHMHCGPRTQRCAAALHVANAIIIQACNEPFRMKEGLKLEGADLTAKKLLEASLCLAWQELREVSMHEQTILFNLLFPRSMTRVRKGPEESIKDNPARGCPLGALIAVFEVVRGSTAELNAALAALTNGLSMGKRGPGVGGQPGMSGVVVETDETAAAVAAAGAAAPALLPAVAVAGCTALFRHMWRLAATQPSNASLWAALCCSTAATAGGSSAAVAADAWAAAARSAAAAAAYTAPAARSAAVQCTAAICSSSAAQLEQVRPQPQLQQVLQGVVLPLLQHSCAADAGSIRTALGCLEAAATAYKGFSLLLQNVSIKDWVDIICALCACSAGRWAWHSECVSKPVTEVNLELLQAQFDASVAFQTLLEAAGNSTHAKHACVSAHELLEASEAAACFHACFTTTLPESDTLHESGHAPVVLCPQVHMAMFAVEHALQRHAFRLQRSQSSATPPTSSPTPEQQPIPEKNTLAKLKSVLHALHTELEHVACRCQSRLERWFVATTAPVATAKQQQLSNQVCQNTVAATTVTSPVATSPVVATGERGAACTVSRVPPSCVGGVEVVRDTAEFLALCAMPMHEQHAYTVSESSSRLTSHEVYIASMINVCIDTSSIWTCASVAAAEAHVATVAAATGTIAVLLPEFPAKRSDVLLTALAAVRRRYLLPLVATSADDSSPLATVHKLADVSGAVSLAAAAVVALSQRSTVTRACMCVLRGGARAPSRGWPQGWLEHGDVSTGARAVGAALKVLCGMCMAAIKRMDGIHGVTDGTLEGPSGHSSAVEHMMGASESAAVTEVNGTVISADMLRRVTMHGVVIQLLTQTFTAVATGVLAGVDTAAVKQTISKLLEGFQKLLEELCGSLKKSQSEKKSQSDPSRKEGVSSIASGECSGKQLVQRAVEVVVVCVGKLPEGIVDAGVCDDLRGVFVANFEQDEAELVGDEAAE